MPLSVEVYVEQRSLDVIYKEYNTYIRCFERKVLRTILENGVWCKCMNHELYQVYKDANIIKRGLNYGRLQWVGHLVRMLKERITKTIFDWEPGRGRQRIRWLYVVEEDLATLNVRGNWRSIAQDR